MQVFKISKEEYINHYIWPGIEQGCDCRFDDYYIAPRRMLFDRTNELFKQECNSSMREAGCKDINEMSSRDFKILPVESGTKKLKLCGLREEGNNSFALNSPKINECKENELKCGTLSDFFYCTQEKECPIFQIKNNSIVESGTQDYFQIIRENEMTLPLVEFKIAQGDGVCKKVNDRSITPGRPNYDLISDPGLECDRDPRFKLIYKFNELDFFQANDALDIAKQAPGYEISSQYQWGLYGRHYINFSLPCREYQQELMDSVDSFDEIESQQQILMIISIISVCITILMFTLNCCTMCGVDLFFIKGKGTEESNTLFFIQFFFKESAQIANAVIIILTFTPIQKLVDFFNNLINRACSDRVTLDEFQKIIDLLITSTYAFDFIYIIIFCVGVFIDFLVGIFLAYKYVQERKRLEEQNKYQDPNNQGQNNPGVYNPYPQIQNYQIDADPFNPRKQNDIQIQA
ncbi:unnamed protein product (macronuclear) [Paramecium tetraurelia]|uniref:Transmembrane protein n=1 Tax=Paramecium tetraurelia TaxID=5888 RepID=A0EIP5_PARTE|nr:uncharacterized protein GSPATT00027515001 [Paramecium tetraurelia]CAK95186.1 unnamed protein product [Paramecium tetraurelia]|eukprot:XP_001462559.1 hypothetical protein (macronuclear) [Paramecium tetraurelia strain d4-2]